MTYVVIFKMNVSVTRRHVPIPIMNVSIHLVFMNANVKMATKNMMARLTRLRNTHTNSK